MGTAIGGLRTVRYRSPWTQAWGLMFRKARPGTLYLFDFGREVRCRFHMWFVFWPIDLHLLDRKGNVVDRMLRFRPFATYLPARPFRFAVESAPGTLPAGIARLPLPLRE